MSMFPLMSREFDEGAALGPMLHEPQEGPVTRRVTELREKVERLRIELQETEHELERELSRWPEVGEFVRCPLTGFFGQVTKVTPRTYGRPWVEILLYLSNDMPGHAKIDLFANWELIDPPSANG